MSILCFIENILKNPGLSTSNATINTQPVRIGPIAGGARTFSTTGGTGSQPLTVRYKK